MGRYKFYYPVFHFYVSYLPFLFQIQLFFCPLGQVRCSVNFKLMSYAAVGFFSNRHQSLSSNPYRWYKKHYENYIAGELKSTAIRVKM